MDELWSYLKNKKHPLRAFVDLKVNSRFWINFELGSRTTHTATKLVPQIKHCMATLSQAAPLKVTTDKLAAYKNSLESVFRNLIKMLIPNHYNLAIKNELIEAQC